MLLFASPAIAGRKKEPSKFEMFNKTFERNQKLIASTLNAFFLLADCIIKSTKCFNHPYAAFEPWLTDEAIEIASFKICHFFAAFIWIVEG